MAVAIPYRLFSSFHMWCIALVFTWRLGMGKYRKILLLVIIVVTGEGRPSLQAVLLSISESY